jgi:hypothetical protein
MPRRSEKITTPTPSLNSDSPAITSSSSFGARADLRIPITAIGSVGEIKAPNSRQWISGRLRPNRGRAAHSPKPTASVDNVVANTASAATDQRWTFNCSRSTCSAPANSSIDSMPCIRTLEKSMERSRFSSYWRTLRPMPRGSSAINAKDSASAAAIVPIVVGSPMYRAFR